ncbi:MAG: mechanosensitive ion channel family protein [Saprospiraceae bacterium]|nr:mechanosensitive ion channel family protein [Saprospiraceae bacterium]
MNHFLETWLPDPLLRRLVIAAIWIILIGGVMALLRQRIFSRIKDTENRYRFRKGVTFMGYIIILVIVLMTFQVKMSGLGLALGVAGAGIAFALQEVITSVAGWMAIVFGGFYQTGDRVQLGGIKGDVIDIGVLRTTLMEMGQWVDADQYNGRIVRIANSFVFKEPVFNYSADFPFIWDEIRVPIRYGSDYMETEKMLQRIADTYLKESAEVAKKTWASMVKKYMIEDAITKPMITLMANDNWVEFTLRYTVDFKRRRITKDTLMRALLQEVDASGGRIQMASTTIEITKFPGKGA